jgi:hypothetical protein
MWGFESLQELSAYGESSGDVFGQNRFLRVVTDPPWAAQEQHRDGEFRSHNHGVVTGAAWYSVDGVARLGGRVFELPYQLRIARNSGLFELRLRGEGQPSGRRDLLSTTMELLDGGRANRIVCVSNVQTHPNFAGNDVAGARDGFNLANGGNQPFRCAGCAFHFQDPFRGSSQGIAAKMHRCGPCMIRLPVEMNQEPALARNRGHDPDRQVQAIEHGPLLDVKLQERERPRVDKRTRDLRWIESELLDGASHGDPMRVGAIEQLLIQRSDKGATPDKRHAKANTFFFRERDDLYREWQSSPFQPLEKR